MYVVLWWAQPTSWRKSDGWADVSILPSVGKLIWWSIQAFMSIDQNSWPFQHSCRKQYAISQDCASSKWQPSEWCNHVYFVMAATHDLLLAMDCFLLQWIDMQQKYRCIIHHQIVQQEWGKPLKSDTLVVCRHGSSFWPILQLSPTTSFIPPSPYSLSLSLSLSMCLPLSVPSNLSTVECNKAECPRPSS